VDVNSLETSGPQASSNRGNTEEIRRVGRGRKKVLDRVMAAAIGEEGKSSKGRAGRGARKPIDERPCTGT